ncbi:MAG: family 16 glycosylhydrolase [Jejuia sp.]
MRILKLLTFLLVICFSTMTNAQRSPHFQNGEDPKPEGTKWKLVKSMSDEFNKKEVNEKKWQISGQRWKGRVPGLFQAENIKQKEGKLQITTKMLEEPKGKFTHGGGYVGSREAMRYGYYECRMKANKTFMSSTFWLITDRSRAKGCDNRTTELDIQECVGEIVSKAEWMVNFDSKMNSNTHSRDIKEGCDIAKGSVKSSAHAGGKVYDDYHVYAVWWKSKDEILFFLDGKFVNQVKPAADFDLDMHLRMVVETYNWNPVPEDGGMNMSAEDRTTYYDWVRTWELVE